jgi:hypothetical protein
LKAATTKGGLKLQLKPTNEKDTTKASKNQQVSQRSLAGTPMYLSPEQKELRANADDLKNKRTRDLVKMQ